MKYEYFMFLQFHDQDDVKTLQIDESDVEKQSEFIAHFMRDPNRPYWQSASIQRRPVGDWEVVYEPGKEKQ